jgi:hypothetical protein
MTTWISKGCVMLPQYFIGLGVWDNEDIPTDNKYLIGITNTGKTFGGWGKEVYTDTENKIDSETRAEAFRYT